MSTAEERFNDYSGFRVIPAEEARRDAESYWVRWRAGLAKTKPFTPGFPELAEMYDPDQGGAPLGTLHCDAAEPDAADGL